MIDQILKNSKVIAQELGLEWDVRLETILKFCAESIDLKAFPGTEEKKIDTSTSETLGRYLKPYLKNYFNERSKLLTFKEVGTTPDKAIDVILQSFANVDNLIVVSDHHRKSMAAENLLGGLLERYLDENLDKKEWIWCCGNTVTSVDFLRSDLSLALQIKNRDNTENSSSSKIRAGTEISKWYRVSSKTGKTKWEEFPTQTTSHLSEEGFYAFIEDYAKRLSYQGE